MDWNAAIEKNREALKRVLATLVAMAGFADADSGSPSPLRGGVRGGGTLPRHLHRAVMRLLRPAEAAARRLVIVAARGLVVKLPPIRPRKAKRKSPLIVVRTRADTDMLVPRWLLPQAGVPRPAPRPLSLSLFDPLPRWPGRWRPAARGVPRIWTPGMSERFPLPAPPSPDDPIDAARLALRLQALSRVLDDLPREARRFARWRARADAANAQIKERYAAGVQGKEIHGGVKLHRLGPLKPGRPPGWRRRPTHEVHDILNVVHGLAHWAMERPDTS